MLSFLMLFIIFFELSIAVVTVLGGILVASQYFKKRNIEDLYVAVVLAGGASTDLGMLFAQVAYSLQSRFAFIGLKIFIASILLCAYFVWFHLSHIYKIRSRIVTFAFSLASIFALYHVYMAKMDMALQDGVIIPVGVGKSFVISFALIALIVGVEAFFSIIGLRKLGRAASARYKISRTAGALFMLFLVCLVMHLIDRSIISYLLMWCFAFFAMLFLALFSLVTEDSPYVRHPFDFFRTRILFKLIITLVLMIIISLEGMGIVSINIAKSALATSVIEGYQRVAKDTIIQIEKAKLNSSSEQKTLVSIARILEMTKIGDRGSVFLVAPSQNVYINRENKWISLGVIPIIKHEKSFGLPGTGGEIDIFGDRIIGAFIPIRNTGWSIIVGQELNYAYSQIRNMEGTFIIFILAWITLTIVVGTVFARNIEDPIKAVKQGLLKIAEGDLDYQIKTKKIDEIGGLANTINDMTRQLKESQESLIRSERLASLGYMAAGMAHEIKNALVPLKTLTEILAVSGDNKEFIAKFNELVPKEIERINTLSTDLLHYSRPSDPVLEIQDLNEIVSESAKFLELQARKKNVALKLELEAKSKVKADRGKIIQALTNLILNAIEAMNGGAITLTTFDTDDNVVVRITDNGPGIPEEHLKKVFLPFFTTKKEGTGMGLAITQRIMADHGGTIELESESNKGTVFILAFPKQSS